MNALKKSVFLKVFFSLILLFNLLFVSFSVDLTDINNKDYIKLKVVNDIEFGVEFESGMNLLYFDIYSYFNHTRFILLLFSPYKTYTFLNRFMRL